MHPQLVMLVIAKDRPGLVESIAAAVASSGGNWLESRMSRLRGHFAGILRFSLPEENRTGLEQALKPLIDAGMRITLLPDDAAVPSAIPRMVQFNLVGQDRPGIVRQISQAFARRGVNVEELITETSSAPMSGETLFHARARIGIPENCSLADLRADFEKIASDLLVDATFEELP